MLLSVFFIRGCPPPLRTSPYGAFPVWQGVVICIAPCLHLLHFSCISTESHPSYVICAQHSSQLCAQCVLSAHCTERLFLLPFRGRRFERSPHNRRICAWLPEPALAPAHSLLSPMQMNCRPLGRTAVRRSTAHKFAFSTSLGALFSPALAGPAAWLVFNATSCLSLLPNPPALGVNRAFEPRWRREGKAPVRKRGVGGAAARSCTRDRKVRLSRRSALPSTNADESAGTVTSSAIAA